MADTILIVDDEEPVRKTFHAWLAEAQLDCQLLTAADAESALRYASAQPIDLAILDWNLGAGNDGLHLLEDLSLFQPDIVAILVTGFASQATPLDAMRMGVRDYLDKNQDLNRATFLQAVRKQLDRIRPAKREKRLHQSLVQFRSAVEKVLPLVQTSQVLHDPVPLPDACAALLRFLQRTTGASEAVLLVHSHVSGKPGAAQYRAYTSTGQQIVQELVPFAKSLAGAVASMQKAYTTTQLTQSGSTGLTELQPFEKGRASLLAAPLAVVPGVQAVFELFDKTSGPFTADDLRSAEAASEFGADLLRRALAQQQSDNVLVEAVQAALRASEHVQASLQVSSEVGGATQLTGAANEPTPTEMLQSLQQSLSTSTQSSLVAGETVQLAEAIRVLGVKHGPAALTHCRVLIEQVQHLLDRVTSVEGDLP